MKEVHALLLQIIQVILETGVGVGIAVRKLVNIVLPVKAKGKRHDVILSVVWTSVVIHMFCWYPCPISNDKRIWETDLGPMSVTLLPYYLSWFIFWNQYSMKEKLIFTIFFLQNRYESFTGRCWFKVQLLQTISVCW